MKNLTKKDVYVKIDTSNVAEVAKLLHSAGEELYNKQSCLSGEVEDYRSIILSDNGEWTRTSNPDEKTEVTLEQLADILGVKQQFKVGDRVRCKSGFSNQYGSNYGGAGYVDGLQFEISKINPDSSIDEIAYFDVDYRYGVFGKALELVEAGKETTIETVTISRANLGRLYPIVCGSWQSYITSLLDGAGSFAVDVQVPLEELRQAYKEANPIQKAILIEVAPLPKVKSTVKVSRWINIYENGEGGVFNTKEEALAVKYSSCTATVELTGEYTTKVEDPLMDLDEIPF